MSELPLANTVSIKRDRYITIRLYHTKALQEYNITAKLSKERKKKMTVVHLVSSLTIMSRYTGTNSLIKIGLHLLPEAYVVICSIATQHGISEHSGTVYPVNHLSIYPAFYKYSLYLGTGSQTSVIKTNTMIATFSESSKLKPLTYTRKKMLWLPFCNQESYM